MIDYIVVLLYISFLFFLALNNKKKNSDLSNKSFYLANNQVSFTESLFSIIATEVSALTFIGIPAFAYSKNFSFIYIYFGAVLGRIIIANAILPEIYGKGITLYQIIIKKKNSSRSAQIALSTIYITGRILGVGVRLYAGSILVSEFFSISIYTAVLSTAIFTFFYTLIGGLKVVVKTDFFQVCLLVFGGIAAHFIITQEANESWFDLMNYAYQNDKIFNLSSFLPEFFIGFIGGILFDICTHGMDQDFVQRLLACKDLKTAQKAIKYSSLLSIFVGLLFLSIGSLLWAFFDGNLPLDVKNDKVFAYFITQYFPPGLKGLMLAGVLAATMSTLDSTINALGSCLSIDVFNRKKITPKIVFWDSLIIILMLLLIAFLSSQSAGILELGLKIASWIGGGILLIYITQVSVRFNSLTAKYVYLVFLLNVALVATNVFILQGPWQLNVYLSVFGGLGVLFLFSKFRLT